ncbi:MAG: hypothetical protein KDC98_14140, partial [Planctomycetes bacterium]|nr:hypothetical protein [Planctomycetota bacterium]
WASSGTTVWFRYSPGAGVVNLGSPPLAGGLVNDINNHGHIVGFSSQGTDQAWLYTNQSGFQNLNNLIPAGSGYSLRDAVAINDAGQILCKAASSTIGGTRTVRLDPVSPLASVTTLGVACSSSSPSPTLSAQLPTLGGALDLRLANAAANAAGIIVGSFGRPAPMPLGACTVYVDQTAIVLSVVVLTDASGNGGFAAALPTASAFAGLSITAQAVLVGTAVPPGVDLTNGVLLRLGN